MGGEGLFKKAPLVRVNSDAPEYGIIEEAACVLREGGLVAFPTETVYGLGVNILDRGAVERLYRVKKRPPGKPLTVHVTSLETVESMGAVIPPHARRLMEAFWPGPLTVVLDTEDGQKKGFRMPSARVALSLITASGVPVGAPSANISGGRPPKDALEVAESLDGNVDMIIDGGPTELGWESTVVDASAYPVKVLREAAIPNERLERVWRDG